MTTALRHGETGSPRIAAAGPVLSVADAHKVVLASLEDSKAEDIVSIDINGKSPLGDFMVIASGRSHRHVNAIAEQLVTSLKQAGGHDIRVEGQRHCDWVLIDTGDIIVHIFRPEVRDFYGIEKMWQSGQPVTPPAA